MDNQDVSQPQDNRGNVVLYIFYLIVIIACLASANAILDDLNHNTLMDKIFVYSFVLILGIVLCIMVSIKRETCYLVDNRFVKKNLTYKDIIPDPHLFLAPNERHFRSPVLVYIPPREETVAREYELALSFYSKFTHISPEWYKLKSHRKTFYLEGEKNVDQEWIRRLRRRGDIMGSKKTLVLPRIVNEVSSDDLLDKNGRDKVVDVIVDECREMGYDGVVLEAWSKWKTDGILGNANMRNKAFAFIKELGYSLHSMRLSLIFIIHPPRDRLFGPTDFVLTDVRSLGNYVDGYSLLTHAFSDEGSPGPDAPLQWIRDTLCRLLPNGDVALARKLFIGLNFVGRDYLLARDGDENNVEVINSTMYQALVAQHQPRMGWDNMSGEHHFIYMDNQLRTHAVFYPSLQSVWMRLGEAEVKGTGVAIHQLGAGLDSFLGLL